MLDKRQPLKFWYFLAAATCFSIIVLVLRGRLGLFVHPRYHTFTLIMATIGFVIMLKATLTYSYKKQTTIEFDSYSQVVLLFGRWLLGKGSWMVIVTVLLIFYAPTTPLLSYTADRKIQNREIDEASIKNASWFYNPEDLYQLDQVLKTDEGSRLQLGKEFTVNGFVQNNKLTDPDILLLSRFVMTCCAIDAIPASIPVFIQAWDDQYSADEWLEVTGKIEQINVGGASRIVLQPDEVRKISQPDNPYDYISF